MIFPENYKKLKFPSVKSEAFELVPIRYEDRNPIMKWRNEQIYHLRQAAPLTQENQDTYFREVVSKIFTKETPEQLLFSLLENNRLIAYGGLVHINWTDKNAEISFVMDTALENERFSELWSEYLSLIKKVAFEDLLLHKIYVYAFDLRPHLYAMLEENNFTREAVLKEHCYFENQFIDVVIYSFIKNS